ncbi:uncharacterized protein ACWYII_002038 isoform 1-T1 [Salvelinus alpinus]
MLSIRLDNLLASRGRPGLSVPFPSTSDPTPMELGGAAMWGTGGGAIPCTTCGRRGHTAGRCWGGSSGSRGSRQGTGGSSQSVSFLGYRLSATGVEMEKDRISAVRNWPTPTTAGGGWSAPAV